MHETNAMQQGWDFYAKHAGTALAVNLDYNYIHNVQQAISDFAANLEILNSGRPEASLAGFLAEEWHAGTFNVKAAAQGSRYTLKVDHENVQQYASADLLLKRGHRTIRRYGLKYYATAEKSAVAQVALSKDRTGFKFQGQVPIVPTDQAGEVREIAKKRALKNKETRPVLSEAYKNVADNADGKVVARRGLASDALTLKDARAKARDKKAGGIDLEQHGITIDAALKPEYIMKQAVKAGLSAAAVTVAIQLTPDIMQAIDYLIKTGHIDLQELQYNGGKAISGGAESFIRGSLASALTVMCQKGLLGEAFRHAAPSLIGTVVAIAVETAKNSIMVAAGKMTTREMGVAFADNAAISAGFLAGAGIGSVVTSAIKGAAIGSAYPGIGTLIGTIIGSLIGCAIAIVHNISKKYLISFCVDTGFTCFGLVEQNYELPPEILGKLGIDTIAIPKTEIRRTTVAQTAIPTTSITRTQFETVELVFVRRGVIGVNKIGYVL